MGLSFLCVDEKSFRGVICKIFKLKEWHYDGISDKEYARITVSKVNAIVRKDITMNDGVIIEVGCGLGDIISNINEGTLKKEGYDIDKRMIYAAKILNMFNRSNVKYYCGSFRNITDKKIECLIMINWLHNISTDDLKKEISYLMHHNSIKWIVMDEVRNDTSIYKYEHDCEDIFGCYGYQRKYNGKRIKAAGKAYRNVVVYKKLKGYSI